MKSQLWVAREGKADAERWGASTPAGVPSLARWVEGIRSSRAKGMNASNHNRGSEQRKWIPAYRGPARPRVLSPLAPAMTLQSRFPQSPVLPAPFLRTLGQAERDSDPGSGQESSSSVLRQKLGGSIGDRQQGSQQRGPDRPRPRALTPLARRHHSQHARIVGMWVCAPKYPVLTLGQA